MSTVATVTIMLILMTTIIIAANSISDNSKRISFASEIKSIQQAVNSYVTKNEGEYPTVNSIVVDISKLDPTYQTQFTANQESVVDGKIILNEIDYQKIGITDLKYGNGKRGTNDIYAVSTQTGKVYYVMGVTISNYSYYTLTSDLSKLLKLNDNQIDDTDPVIIFTPNKIEWTNQEIKVSIKIPKIFSLLEIKVNGTEISITDPIEEGSYNVYNVSNPGNYSIDVTYRKSGDSVENSYAKYSVTNFDNVAPTFTLSEAKKMEGGNLSSYVDITSKVENGSGLKKIKYEYNGIYDSSVFDGDKNSVKSHFENNGINLDTKATVIPITKGTRKLTVYMEDNAGNWSMQTLAFTQNTENNSGIISQNQSYVGYYADVDGDKQPDGVIYVDLADTKYTSGRWNNDTEGFWSDYEYTPVTEGLKQYEVCSERYTGFGNKWTRPVITAVEGTTGADRFYVMALEDFDTEWYYWYEDAYGKANTSESETVIELGQGKQNTIDMIATWNKGENGGYGAQGDRDMWGVIQTAVGNISDPTWFVPSKAEWAAFGDFAYTKMGVDTKNYASYGLQEYYWSSSQHTTDIAYFAYFSVGYIRTNYVNNFYYVRLSTTF